MKYLGYADLKNLYASHITVGRDFVGRDLGG